MEAGSERKERTKALFKKGQRCLVRYMDQYWAALVLRARKTEIGHFYLVHYDGWSKKHDEEVPQSDIIKYNPDMIGPIPGTGADEDGGPGSLISAKKRKQDPNNSAVEVAVELRVHMPPMLKMVVLKDYEMVTQLGQLLPLPRSSHSRPSVAEALDQYLAVAVADVDDEAGLDAAGREARRAYLRVATEWLLDYFDQTLAHYLLYHQEVAPHGEATANGELPRTVYGAEHLVRLFVKLPELVPVAHMTPQDAVRLEAFLHGLMQHISGPAQAQLFSSREQYVPNQAFAPELLLPPAAPTTTAAGRRPPPGGLLATPEPSRDIAVS